MNKRMMSAILALLMICTMCMHVLAQGEVTVETAEKHVELPDDLKSEISAFIQSWAEDNYGEHYTLSGYEDEYHQSSVSGTQVETNVMVSFYTTLKYENVEDLPYMQGVKEYLNADSLSQVVESGYAASLSESAAEQLQISEEIAFASTRARSNASAKENILSALPEIEPEVADKIVRQISDQYVDAAEAIGQPTDLALDLHVTCSYDGAHASNILLQYVNIDGSYDDIGILALPSKGDMLLQASESFSG